MEKMEAIKLFEFYKDTIDKCGMYLLKEDDDTVAYNIFEEFDIGIQSFLHSDSLNELYLKGFISENKMIKSISLRDKVIVLRESIEWNVESLRTSPKWKEILSLCDEIKAIN